LINCWWSCCWFLSLCLTIAFWSLNNIMILNDGCETCAAAGIVSQRLGPCFCVFDCVSPRAPFCRVLGQDCAAVGGCHAAGAGGAHRSHESCYFSCVWRERKGDRDRTPLRGGP
jgi:hypothetical protein